MLSFLVVALSLFSFSSCQLDGKWTYFPENNFLPMYICQTAADSLSITGVYSEYGYIRGLFTTSLTVEGRWYEIGLRYKNGNVTTGTFIWTFDSNYESFSGYFWEEGVAQLPELGYGKGALHT